MVQFSRKMLQSPTSRAVGSPIYFKSCDFPPTNAKGKNSFPRPNFECPSRTTWECRIQSSPSSTCAPTTQNGPIWTLVPSLAKGETMAVWWITRQMSADQRPIDEIIFYPILLNPSDIHRQEAGKSQPSNGPVSTQVIPDCPLARQAPSVKLRHLMGRRNAIVKAVLVLVVVWTIV